MAADSLVGESVADPGKYYRNNVVAGLALLDAMRGAACDGSSSRRRRPSTASRSSSRSRRTTRRQPTNPYGETKLAFEHALRWYAAAYGLSSISLRYFNAAGATARCGERHDPRPT